MSERFNRRELHASSGRDWDIVEAIADSIFVILIGNPNTVITEEHVKNEAAKIASEWGIEIDNVSYVIQNVLINLPGLRNAAKIR